MASMHGYIVYLVHVVFASCIYRRSDLFGLLCAKRSRLSTQRFEGTCGASSSRHLPRWALVPRHNLSQARRWVVTVNHTRSGSTQ